MLEMVKDKIKKMTDFLRDEKIEYKRACSLFNGYLLALTDFNLITSEEAYLERSNFCLKYYGFNKEEK